MAAAAAAAAPACLCVLCGLPAAGKSTLARTLLRTAALRGWRATVVSYDHLIPEHAFRTRGMQDGDPGQDMHTEWKSHRQAVLRCIELFLEEDRALAELPGSCQIDRAAWQQCIGPLLQTEAADASQNTPAPLLFLLDDNFYYPSMRHEVYQLARKYSLGFCQVYLHCDLEACISRNQSRPEPVPGDVIREMVRRLESPNPQKNSWEANSISLNTTGSLSTSDLQTVMELISSALQNPPSPVEDNSEQMEADRLKCATSVLHQADQACRRLISESMRSAGGKQASPELMKTLAAQLNESKARFLQDLRRELLQEAAITQEDFDVERVVKRAVEVFDRGRQEILLRLIDDNK